MLLSMTGFGEARGQAAGFAVSVEVRAVNNRYLKVTVRGSDPYPMLEPELETLFELVLLPQAEPRGPSETAIPEPSCAGCASDAPTVTNRPDLVGETTSSPRARAGRRRKPAKTAKE